MAIYHDNIIYISNISKLGGVEAYAYYMVKKYKDLDICVLCKSGDAKQLDRIRRYCPAYVYRGQEFECKVLVINYDTSILDLVKFDKCYMVIHADYTQPCYTIYPKWDDPRITKVLGITKHICDIMQEHFNVKCELCYNPLVPEEKQKRIVLVSATRLSKIKGGWRIKALAEKLTLAGINFIWYIFTNENDNIHLDNVIFMQERLDVYKWIQEADYLVQLSDTEACSYSINEALMYGTKVIVTPLPYLDELNIKGDNALILDFDLKNINDIVEQIKMPTKVMWQPPADNYNNLLAQGKSKYTQEMSKGMKRIKVKARFKDMKHNNILRFVGEEFIEEDARATDLIERGYAYLIEDIKPVETKVEKAVKEVKKEKAVKEKATKVVKKNAKK